MSSGRVAVVARGLVAVAARVASLPPELVAEALIISLTSGVAAADAFIATAAPIPEWATASIFLSSDLLPTIFAPLEMVDNACASVCKLWHQVWRETDHLRRGLRVNKAFSYPALPSDFFVDLMIGPPTGDWYFVHGLYDDGNLSAASFIADTLQDTVRRLKSSLRYADGCVADGMIYLTTEDEVRQVRDFNDELMLMAMYELGTDDDDDDEPEPRRVAEVALAPEVGTLFAVSCCNDLAGEDEVVALDASTLTVRHKFGRGTFKKNIMGLAVDDASVYAGDNSIFHCIRVFTFTGEPVREVRGNWGRPEQLQHFAGRLYMLEKGSEHDEIDGPVHVLTPEGEVLQLWQPQDWEVGGMHIAGGHLMVYSSDAHESDPAHSLQLLALKGI